MKKRYVQGVLCAVAIIHLYLQRPLQWEGEIDVSVYLMNCMGWQIKHLLKLPLIYGFLILGIHFLWPSGQR